MSQGHSVYDTPRGIDPVDMLGHSHTINDPGHSHIYSDIDYYAITKLTGCRYKSSFIFREKIQTLMNENGIDGYMININSWYDHIQLPNETMEAMFHFYLSPFFKMI